MKSTREWTSGRYQHRNREGMMKRAFLFLYPLIVAASAPGDALGFGSSSPILCNGTPVDVGTYSDPLVVDWDKDGLKDLIVCQFNEGSADVGKIRIYLNVGTSASPVFSSWDYMQADGTDIVCPSG
jgi:hypothetical protein